MSAPLTTLPDARHGVLCGGVMLGLAHDIATLPDLVRAVRLAYHEQAARASRRLNRAHEKSMMRTAALRDEMLDYIREHPGCRRRDIAAAAGMDERAISYHLSAMVRAGDVVSEGRSNSKWWFVSPEVEE